MRAAIFCILILTAVQPVVAAPDTLVICPQEFRSALVPWESFRRAQGHEIAVVAPPADAREVAAEIRRAASAGSLKFVVVIGDVPGRRTSATAVTHEPSITVPTSYVDAHVNIRWGPERTIATDETYEDIDGDGMPDIAIGRIPADTPEELAAVVRKLIRYEQQADHDLWRRRIDIVAGIGGLGPVTDAIVTAAARSVIQQTVPASFEVQQTNANPGSPFCPPPGQFTAHVCQQWSDGAFAWIYLGHGLPGQLDAVATPHGPRPILSAADAPLLRCGAASPLAVLIACYTGALDAPQDCLAERMLTSDDGPVAVIAATRVTMPYGNAVLGCELLRACFQDHPATLGELWLQAQRHTLADAPNDSLRIPLDALAAGLSPPAPGDPPGQPANLAAERREHVMMYQLLGDPLMQLRYPKDMQLTASIAATNGNSITIDGETAVAGECFLGIEPASGPTTNPRDVPRVSQSVERGKFRIVIPAPPGAAGTYTVRAFVAGENEFAAGATTVDIERAATQQVAGRIDPVEPQNTKPRAR